MHRICGQIAGRRAQHDRGRLAGAFRNSGRGALAEEMARTMSAAGYALRETDPFTDRSPVALSFRETSPYVNRNQNPVAEDARSRDRIFPGGAGGCRAIAPPT